VAVETIGNWYWIVDEIEAAGCVPKLVHARKAKLMMGEINKTDRLDVRGLNRLQQAGTLPTVWIPPGELRDQRELPPHTAYASRQLLEQIEVLDGRVRDFEKRIQAIFKPTPMVQQQLTLPGVGLTLAVVIALERGDVTRFATAEKLAGYAGTTPRVHASGGKTRFGPSRPDVNRYLKWAFVEAANAVCLTRGRTPRRHVSRLYERVARRKGHAKAIGAVARHLAEATYWMLSKGEAYREPKVLGRVRPRGISAEAP
jgi:transposase